MAQSGPPNRFLEKAKEAPGYVGAYIQCVCTGWKRWNQLMEPPPQDLQQKQAQNTTAYQDNAFKTAPADKSYGEGVVELRTDKYIGTVYILHLQPLHHRLKVFHMDRNQSDPATASVVLFEQYKAAAQQAQLQSPWQLDALPNINVDSDLGAKAALVIGIEKELSAPSVQVINSSSKQLTELQPLVSAVSSTVNPELKGRKRDEEVEGALLKNDKVLACLNSLSPDLCDFLALLGIENGASAIWLIKDYGPALGITGLDKIVIDHGGQDVTYHFRH